MREQLDLTNQIFPVLKGIVACIEVKIHRDSNLITASSMIVEERRQAKNKLGSNYWSLSIGIPHLTADEVELQINHSDCAGPINVKVIVHNDQAAEIAENSYGFVVALSQCKA